MAMRWSFCNAVKPLFMALLAGACVHTVTRYYIPDANNPRFDLDGATQVLDQYMSVQCPQRLAEKKAESGEVRLTILADTSGAVTRAELTTSSGDAMVDGLFGTVAAQLKADSLRAPQKGVLTRRVRIGYSCAPNAAVATLEVLRK
jgi:TonB family protein